MDFEGDCDGLKTMVSDTANMKYIFVHGNL